MCALSACDYFSPMKGESAQLAVSFDREGYLLTRAGSSDLPDTNAFLLTVTSSKGKILYEGPYGEAPDPIVADPGSYTVEAVSVDFSAPAFSKPQYGDRQVLVLLEGEKVGAELHCTQLNAGVRTLTGLPASTFEAMSHSTPYLRSTA